MTLQHIQHIPQNLTSSRNPLPPPPHPSQTSACGGGHHANAEHSIDVPLPHPILAPGTGSAWVRSSNGPAVDERRSKKSCVKVRSATCCALMTNTLNTSNGVRPMLIQVLLLEATNDLTKASCFVDPDYPTRVPLLVVDILIDVIEACLGVHVGGFHLATRAPLKQTLQTNVVSFMKRPCLHSATTADCDKVPRQWNVPKKPPHLLHHSGIHMNCPNHCAGSRWPPSLPSDAWTTLAICASSGWQTRLHLAHFCIQIAVEKAIQNHHCTILDKLLQPDWMLYAKYDPAVL